MLHISIGSVLLILFVLGVFDAAIYETVCDNWKGIVTVIGTAVAALACGLFDASMWLCVIPALP